MTFKVGDVVRRVSNGEGSAENDEMLQKIGPVLVTGVGPVLVTGIDDSDTLLLSTLSGEDIKPIRGNFSSKCFVLDAFLTKVRHALEDKHVQEG